MQPAMPSRTPAMPLTTLRRPSRTSKLFELTTNSGKGRPSGRPFFLGSTVIAMSGTTRQSTEHDLDCFASVAMTKSLLFAMILLAACQDHRPPAPTAEQSQQLNEAENML